MICNYYFAGIDTLIYMSHGYLDFCNFKAFTYPLPSSPPSVPVNINNMNRQIPATQLRFDSVTSIEESSAIVEFEQKARESGIILVSRKITGVPDELWPYGRDYFFYVGEDLESGCRDLSVEEQCRRTIMVDYVRNIAIESKRPVFLLNPAKNTSSPRFCLEMKDYYSRTNALKNVDAFCSIASALRCL